jgi:sec-independent protein translocase protein TatA
LLVVLLILLLLFGASRVPRLARSMGRSAKEFKAGLNEGERGLSAEGPCPFCASTSLKKRSTVPVVAKATARSSSQGTRNSRRPVRFPLLA